MKFTAFRDVILYSLVDIHRRFAGTAARSSETAKLRSIVSQKTVTFTLVLFSHVRVGFCSGFPFSKYISFSLHGSYITCPLGEIILVAGRGGT
jgi:hypothetical protein